LVLLLLERVGVSASDDGVNNGVFGLIDHIDGEIDRIGRVQLSVVGPVLRFFQIAFCAVLIPLGS
jgi:hypothetical protein